MADSRVSKTVEFNYIDNGSERVLKTAQDLQSVFKSLDNLTRNGKLSTYWTDQASLIKRTEKAYKAYNEQATKDNAKELLKTTNALKALSGGVLPEALAGFDKIENTLKGLKSIELDSMFSVESFQGAFRSMELMEKAGLDVQEIFSKFNVDTSGFEELNQKLETSEKRVADLRVQLENTQSELKNVKNGTQVGILEDQIKDLEFDLRTVNLELDEIRENAVETFKAFLKANNLVSKNYRGYDNYDDYSFQKYITQIEEGTMDAQQAIEAFKREWSYLFEGTSSDAFGIEQLQDFSKRLDDVNEKLTSVSMKIDEIRTNGVKTNSFDDTLNTRLFDTEQFTKITSLFETIESHLSSLRKVISDVGDGDELSPLLSTIKEIDNAIDSLNNTVKNTNFGTSLNLDFGDIGGKYDEQLSKAQRRKMLAYKKLFEDMRSTGKVTKEAWKFVEPEGLSDDELSGIYKQMIEHEKSARGSNLFKRVIDENSKEIKNAQAAVNRARKNTENNNNLQEILGFEKTDLTGVISQLETIANKLDTIASSAKTMGEAFSSGLNVSASLEEVSKLTERVKELESELQKVKSAGVVSGDKTDLSTGGKTASNTQNITDSYKEVIKDAKEATKSAREYSKVISQVGQFELDNRVSAVFKENEGQLRAVTWKAKRDKKTNELQYDENGDKIYESTSSVISKYSDLEKAITKADDELRDLQIDLAQLEVYAQYDSTVSTKGIEERIAAQREWIKLLEQTAIAMSDLNEEDGYIMSLQQISDARQKRAKEYYAEKNVKYDKDSVSRESTITKAGYKVDNAESEMKRLSTVTDEASGKFDELKSKFDLLNEDFRNGNISAEMYNSKMTELLHTFSEYIKLQKSLQESANTEFEQQTKAQKKQFEAFQKEQSDYEQNANLEKRNQLYKELITSIERYGTLSKKKLTDGLTSNEELELTNLEEKISKLQKSPILSTQQIDASEKKLISLYNALEKIEQAQEKTARTDAQKSVDQALKAQLSSWKGIQSVREQLSKTTDASQVENLKKQGQLYLEEYNNAGKVLQANKELYDSRAHINEMMLVTLQTNDKIAKNQANQAKDQKAAIDSMVSSSQKIVNGFSQKNNVFPSEKYKVTVQKATDALKEMEAIQDKITKEQNGVATEKQTERIKELKKEIDDYNKTVSKMTVSDKGSTDLKAIKEIEKIGDALRKNTRMSSEAKAQLNSYISELRNNPAANVEEIAAAWKKVVVAEKEAGRGDKSLFSAVGEKAFYGLAGQIAGMVSLYDVINVGKQAINQIIELDTALVDLQKTTTMSSSQLNQFYYDANDVAKQMGVTTQEIIEQASAWSRLGYSSAEAATQMAQLSSQFASISPGMETSDAQEGLVSIMKAWNIGVDDVKSEIMDKINILGRCMPKHVVIHGAVVIAA